jgi:CRP/FNR family transcriptional regulator
MAIEDPVLLFPFGPGLSARGADKLRRFISTARFPAGTVLLDEGSRCETLLLVRSGAIRVIKASPAGREITLYFVQAGEMCVLGISCLLSDHRYPATAVTKVDTDALVVPGGIFRELFREEPAVQQFVIDLFSLRLTAVMTLVEEVAFRKMDQRLAAFLLRESSGGPGLYRPVEMSHEQIAGHLGTAREVVSRILSQFEEDGLIALERRRVRIADPAKLSEMTPPGNRRKGPPSRKDPVV